MKKILTYGTFDLLHIGHINILKRAKELGDYLVVGISTDEFNQIKGKKSIYSYEERKQIIEAIRYVDEVIPEAEWEQKEKDIKVHNINILVMGDDWANSDKFSLLKDKVELVFLARTTGISTTEIKTNIKEEK